MPNANSDDDEWETDPDFSNEKSEKEQRYGAARKEGTAMDMSTLREEVIAAQESKAKAKCVSLSPGKKTKHILLDCLILSMEDAT
jgi:hypothetical protein